MRCAYRHGVQRISISDGIHDADGVFPDGSQMAALKAPWLAKPLVPTERVEYPMGFDVRVVVPWVVLTSLHHCLWLIRLMLALICLAVSVYLYQHQDGDHRKLTVEEEDKEDEGGCCGSGEVEDLKEEVLIPPTKVGPQKTEWDPLAACYTQTNNQIA